MKRILVLAILFVGFCASGFAAEIKTATKIMNAAQPAHEAKATAAVTRASDIQSLVQTNITTSPTDVNSVTFTDAKVPGFLFGVSTTRAANGDPLLVLTRESVNPDTGVPIEGAKGDKLTYFLNMKTGLLVIVHSYTDAKGNKINDKQTYPDVRTSPFSIQIKAFVDRAIQSVSKDDTKAQDFLKRIADLLRVPKS